MTDPDTPSPSLLSTLRARQQTSRTAQVARTLGAGGADSGASNGAFNSAAAAALNGWREP
ncbi:MAG: hypothetical protein PGN23_03095 [Sphingomonas adhaesiva]|uniref:hypothetical protein n=1 Tax=Sphingomonas adhaesiva TaxID=28212 RepID=UPI002FF492B8